MDRIDGSARVGGRVRPYWVPDSALPAKLGFMFDPFTRTRQVTAYGDRSRMILHARRDWTKNDVLYSWGAIAARLLTSAKSLSNYTINGMYFEYKNVADPDDPVTTPIFDRSEGLSYYDDLTSSPDVDFIRTPIVAATIDSSDTDQFPDVNRMTFLAMTSGIVGINGKAFSADDNSKVYGGALVAMPDPGDRTQDVIFSRFYFDTDNQMAWGGWSMGAARISSSRRSRRRYKATA